MQKITIAIDGFSSTGKSTVAKQLAKHLGYVYVDTGAMYRAVTLFTMQNGWIDNNQFDVVALVSHLDAITINFQFNPKLGFAEVYLNGNNVEHQIRTLEVSSFVSKVAAIPEVRYQLVKQQQQMGKDKGVVMDGRDIGTVVFPYAELKIFMTASADKRAKRRFDELVSRGDEVDYEDVLRNVQERDYIDSHREDSPLVKADDAIEIDNSDLTLKDQFDKVLDLVTKTVSS
ncbi:(d)CMP kinase [Olleya aquimaris]|uniref:Cytidylate kinase n=1 Tax=Olleya sediminilitoris TaxID=2795739 RepID=A0ABS1WNV3_9FLAO|nr:(d)CMP kinase [Olleya sediminilitoris]AXO79080.1 (d)CMP kinase [Olleya aquimaris]MBL7560788.1 (d)CMP kinase [Olleya sediminilitoris]